MMRMIFIKLPVQDLDVARDFYGSLGFSFNEHASDGQSASVVVDDHIVVTLLTRDRFAENVAGEVGDPSRGTTVLNCLTADSSGEVDDLVARALANGGQPWLPAREGDATYTGSFTDPDGHVWEIMWMGQQHVIN